MKRSFCKKILCTGLCMLFCIQVPMVCSAEQTDNTVVVEEQAKDEYVLNDFSRWKLGQYSSASGAYESWSGRVCYVNDLEVVSGAVYRLFETDNTYNMVVLQLDSDLNVLGKESYKNGGEIAMTADTTFVRVYIYNPDNYSMTVNQYKEAFENGYGISMKLIDNYSNLINETDLTNAGLWEKGDYSAEKGEINTASSIRMMDYKEVEAGATYSCLISEDDYYLRVVQLDEAMNILGECTLKNGGECTMYENSKYIRVSLTDKATYNLNIGVFTQLCESGLELGLNKLDNYSNYISDTDLTNMGLWESGLYDSVTGNKKSGGYSIRLINKKSCMPGTEYTAVMSNIDFRLSVLEYAEDGTYIKINYLYNGESFVTDERTSYVSVSLCISNTYSMSYSKYLELFSAEDFVFTLNMNEVEEPIDPENPVIPEIPTVPEPEGGIEEGNQGNDTLEPYYLFMEDSIIQLSITDDSYRVIVEEYDAGMQYIGSTDLGNLDYLYVNENTTYVSMSVYQFENGRIIDGTFKTITENNNNLDIELISANDLTVDSDKEALFGPELNAESTSNIANYRYGWYKSWGGSYEYSTGGICSRNYYKVTQDSYIVNINDSRIGVSLREYDASGKWLKCVDSLYGGDVYIPSENTDYVTLTVKSTEWATGPFDLLGCGLVIDFSDKIEDYSTEKVDIEAFDFSDKNNWRSGKYVYGTSEFGLDKHSLCTTKFLYVKDMDYSMMADLWNSYLKMHILEVNEEGTVIKTTTLYDGQKWNKQAETAYIGIWINYEKNYDVTYYKQQLDAGYINTLEKFEKYNYNTVMNPITADGFMDIMNVGWNLGNSLDSHYGDRKEDNPALGQERTWGNITITKELIDHIADLGFNTIRIPVTWYYNTYTDENGNLKVHEEWFDRVQDVVDYAIANDMYVFLNTHHEQPIIFTGTDEDTFAQVLSDAEDLWREIATYFKDYDEHLIFEAYNEVDNIEQSWSYSAKSAEQMNRLNQVFVDTVRSTGGNNVYRILCVPTLLDGYNSLILADYIKPSDPSGEGYLLTQIHTYSYQFDQDIEALFVSLEDFAKENNLPVIIGEFGTKPSYSPIEYREEATSNFVARANAHGLRCIYWDDGNLNNYGIVNRRDFSASEHEIIDALITPLAYRSTNKVTIDSMDSFLYMTLNQSTGELKEDKYWGTIVTDIEGHGIEIPTGSDYLTLNLASTNGATLQKIHYVHFYDAGMQFISAVNSGTGFQSKTLDIPENAVYIRVGINNSYSATNVLKFHKFFMFGEMKLTLGFIDKDSEDSVAIDPMDGTTSVTLLNPSQPVDLISLMENINFSDFNIYESGCYYYSTGVKTEDAGCIRVNRYIEVQNSGNDAYIYTTSKNSVRMSVIELDSDMKYLTKTDLVNGKTVTLNANTKYLAVTLSNPYVNYEVNYNTYQGFFEEGMKITLEKQ